MVPSGLGDEFEGDTVLGTRLLSRSRRITLLIAVAYVSAAVGLVVSFLAGEVSPESTLTTVGVALLGLSFVCLFVVSVTIQRLFDGGRP